MANVKEVKKGQNLETIKSEAIYLTMKRLDEIGLGGHEETGIDIALAILAKTRPFKGSYSLEALASPIANTAVKTVETMVAVGLL